MFFLIFILTTHQLYVASGYANCTLSARDDGTQSDARILSAYSTAMGSVLNLSFFDTGQLLGAEYLYPGSMRFPGGAVANYWNFSNASIIQPCISPPDGYCNSQIHIDQWPLQTFSAKNFQNGISSASPLNESKIIGVHSLVFDMNLLTLYDQEMLNQVDVLKSEITSIKLKYLELGNEYYLSAQYNWSIPNSTYYMNKAMPLIKKIRSEIPDGSIAVVAKRPVTGSNVDAWNDGIAAFKSEYDAVTIHDYSCYSSMHTDKITNMDQVSYILLYGQSVIPQYTKYVADKFGADKTIWMTEYNWATHDHFNNTWNYQAIHSIFSIGYISASICNNDMMEILMYYIWSSQIKDSNVPDISGYSYQQMLMYNSFYSNDTNHTYYDIGGQINAHFGWLSMIKNDKMYCLNIVNNECPKVGLNIVGNDELQCLYGVGFGQENNDQNGFGFAIVNACQYEVSLSLNLDGITTLAQNVTVDIWWYLWNDRFDGFGTERFVDCQKGKKLWQCGKYKPGYQQMNVDQGAKEIKLVLKSLSLTLGASQ